MRWSGVILALCCNHLCGCVIDSVCYNDADCQPTHACDRPKAAGGECRKRCDSSTDCTGRGRVCDSRPYLSTSLCLPRCSDDTACPEGHLCDAQLGTCFAADCRTDEDCDPRFECIEGRCISRQPLLCSSDMVAIENQFCIDIYEASRPDATEISVGMDNASATSRPNVLPWIVDSNATAQSACEAGGKTLCAESHWQRACAGPERTRYAYGNTYSPTICNGIDKYCQCASGACASEEPCPFAHCYRSCGVTRGLAPDPTGSNPGCTNAYGVFDINGNVWEHVLDGNDMRVRGGAYNCLDSEMLHQCDYIPGSWTPSARGFRCCSLGLTTVGADGGSPDGGDP